MNQPEHDVSPLELEDMSDLTVAISEHKLIVFDNGEPKTIINLNPDVKETAKVVDVTPDQAQSLIDIAFDALERDVCITYVFENGNQEFNT